MLRFKVTENDDGNLIMFVVDKNAAAVDLTGATSIFSMWKAGAATSKIQRELVQLIAADGKTRLVVASDDFDEKGKYLASIKTTFADARTVTTNKNEFMVEAQAPQNP